MKKQHLATLTCSIEPSLLNSEKQASIIPGATVYRANKGGKIMKRRIKMIMLGMSIIAICTMLAGWAPGCAVCEGLGQACYDAPFSASACFFHGLLGCPV